MAVVVRVGQDAEGVGRLSVRVEDAVRRSAAGVRASLVAVLGVGTGVAANLATNGVSLVRWRWWLVWGGAGLGVLAGGGGVFRGRGGGPGGGGWGPGAGGGA